MDELLTTQELAKYLKLHPTTIIRKAQKGEIPAIRVGKQFRFDRGQIDKWLLQSTMGRPLQILVVDDEPVILRFFTDALRRNGYQVTTTASGVEALGLITNGRFDLVFLDLMMPELDGAEAFRRIREIDKQVPIAIITGYPDSDLMKKVMEYGPFMVLKKPLSLDDILKTVHSFTRAMTTQD